ncbi:MAG: hypothetical protein J7K54_02380 [Candidatus Aenigmarchaeota archaeon]|nr:hypothetical protein [Candidatus Aenigmarchaeota archaeon]
MSEDVARNIERILRDAGVEHKITEHEPVYTSEEAANVRGVELKTGVKALVLKTKKGDFLMGLCPGDSRLDLKNISHMEGSRVSLASRDAVIELTGCEPGSVPPFGYRKKLKTYMDRNVLKNKWVNFNIGLHTKSASMKSSDLEKIIKPILIENV